MLGLNIREGAPLRASNVHNGLEDVRAAQGLDMFFLEKPKMAKAWATEKRNAFWQGQARGKPRIRNQCSRKGNFPKRNDQAEEGDESMSDEILKWEDVIDYDWWPKSPLASD